MIHGIVSNKVEVMGKKERVQESRDGGKLQAKQSQSYVTFVGPPSRLYSRMKRKACACAYSGPVLDPEHDHIEIQYRVLECCIVQCLLTRPTYSRRSCVGSAMLHTVRTIGYYFDLKRDNKV